MILWAREPARTGHLISYPQMPDHLVSAVYDNGGELIPVPEIAAMMADGWVKFVTDFGLRPEDFLACEMQVYHPGLRIAGTVDAIVKLTGYGICGRPGAQCHRGEYCPGEGTHLVAQPGNVLVLLIDFKTGKNPSGTWKEQIATYIRMPECRPDKTDDRVYPMPHIDAGVVLHLRPPSEYPDGYSLQLVAIEDDGEAWGRFTESMDLLRGRRECRDRPGYSVRPLRADGTMPGDRLCDLAAMGYGRALAPLRDALGAACELERLATYTAAEIRDIDGIGPKAVGTVQAMLAERGLHLVPGWRLDDMGAEGYAGLTPLVKALGGGFEVARLAQFTAADIRALNGVGPKILATVRQMLGDHGLSLTDDPARAGKAA